MLIILVALAVAIYLLVRFVQRRSGGGSGGSGGTGGGGTRRPPTPPRAPDDDPGFLRELDEKLWRQRRAREKDEPS